MPPRCRDSWEVSFPRVTRPVAAVLLLCPHVTPVAHPPFLRVPRIHTHSCGRWQGGDQARNPWKARVRPHCSGGQCVPIQPPTHTHTHTHTHTLTLTLTLTQSEQASSPPGPPGLVLPLVRALTPWPNRLSFLGHPPPPPAKDSFQIPGFLIRSDFLADITKRQNRVVVRAL